MTPLVEQLRQQFIDFGTPIYSVLYKNEVPFPREDTMLTPMIVLITEFENEL
jgi:hypothetical protein